MLRAAGPKGEKLRALFVTVDPERDTPETMKSYLGSFDPRIVGLSGDRPAIDAMIKAYRAYSRKVPLQGDDYTMDHTALVYLMGKDGGLHRRLQCRADTGAGGTGVAAVTCEGGAAIERCTLTGQPMRRLVPGEAARVILV